MKNSPKIFNSYHKVSAIFMMLALLWLTISLPLVLDSQRELAKENRMENLQSPITDTEEETANALTNTTEEKAPGNSSTISEEYLHDNHLADYISSIASQKYKCENSGIYNAFHGEVHVPPPNVA